MSRSLTEFPKDIERQRRGAMNAAKTQREKRKPGPIKAIGVKVKAGDTTGRKPPHADADFGPLENAWGKLRWE